MDAHHDGWARAPGAGHCPGHPVTWPIWERLLGEHLAQVQSASAGSRTAPAQPALPNPCPGIMLSLPWRTNAVATACTTWSTLASSSSSPRTCLGLMLCAVRLQADHRPGMHAVPGSGRGPGLHLRRREQGPHAAPTPPGCWPNPWPCSKGGMTPLYQGPLTPLVGPSAWRPGGCRGQSALRDTWPGPRRGLVWSVSPAAGADPGFQRLVSAWAVCLTVRSCMSKPAQYG